MPNVAVPQHTDWSLGTIAPPQHVRDETLSNTSPPQHSRGVEGVVVNDVRPQHELPWLNIPPQQILPGAAKTYWLPQHWNPGCGACRKPPQQTAPGAGDGR